MLAKIYILYNNVRIVIKDISFLGCYMGYEALKNINVLYVEDEDMVRMPTTMLLKRAFKKVFDAENSEIALGILKSEEIDIVITDILMQGMGGQLLAKKIRAQEPDLPIVVVSAFNDNTHIVPEANARLVKPIKKDDLLSACMNVLNLS